MEAGDDLGMEIRYWASRHVDAEYIAATFGEAGKPTKDSAMRDAEPGDPLYEITIEVKRTYIEMVCIGCNRGPFNIPEYLQFAREEFAEPDAWVWENESTLNVDNGHFACTGCYIKMGQPVGKFGSRWVAP